MKLTAIIPTLNEELNILEALNSVSFADEIIVIDSFSSDKTEEIAKKAGAKIISRIFDNYSNQKNFAIDQATNDWILILDADERIPAILKEEIITELKNPQGDIYWVYRLNSFMGATINSCGWQKDKVVRLFNRTKGKYAGIVHEEIESSGKHLFLKNKLIHNPYVSLSHFIEKQDKYAQMQADVLNKKHKSVTLYHLSVKPFFRFFKHYVLQKGIFDGYRGLIISSINSFFVFNRYVRLWLLNNNLK